MSAKVAIVTGANRGIGLAIVNSLRSKFTGDVFLTSRDPGRGHEAVKSLKNGHGVKYHQLDILDQSSMHSLYQFMSKNYGGVDILINNAGVKVKTDCGADARVTIETNVFGTRLVSNMFFPILKPNARVVNVAGFVSGMAMKKCSSEIQEFFRSDTITEDQLINKMKEFITLAEEGSHVHCGFADMPYGISKIGVAVLSKIHAKKLHEMGKKDVLLNACCPGWTHTDMGGAKAPKTPQQAAQTPVSLALLSEQYVAPHGSYISGKREIKL